MTRLVFIAREFNEEGLIERLDDCVLTDAEMDDDWGSYLDPFEPEDQRELALSQ